MQQPLESTSDKHNHLTYRVYGEKGQKNMYRLTIADHLIPNTHKWYDTFAEAYEIAHKIIANKDAESVSIYDCKAKQYLEVLSIY